MANADRLIEIFDEAKARLAGPERADYLAHVCGDDNELKELVLSLLQADQDAGDFLSNSLNSENAALTEKPGDTIGRYKLLEKLGEGGCGVVYMAEQESPVRRRVALKVIKAGMDTNAVIARFEAERQALAMMEHSSIARVYDAGATEAGRPFFVMELVRGVRITEYCEQNKLGIEARLKLFLEVCQAVQHAHQKGIIHRDIKPSNIMVAVNDGVAVPKVIDFGIAKATGEPLTNKTCFTRFYSFLGTPAYTSPEQAEMSSVDVDTRTDIYSLGVLLYEMLTGWTPFDSEELLLSGLDEMRRTIREREPARPSARLTQEIREAQRSGLTDADRAGVLLFRQGSIPAIRGDLDWIVMKCLEKDRSRRYASVNEIAADLRRHQNSEPITARPPGRWYEFQKTVRRHKFGFAAGAALIAVLTLGVLASTWQAVRATRAERDTASALLAVTRAKTELEVDSYFHRITLAHRELSLNNLAGALKMLGDCPLKLRGWEWYYLDRLARVEPISLQNTNAVYSMAFHPDGQKIAGAGRDGIVRVWDLASRKLVQKLQGHTNYIFSVAFRPPGGRHVASAGADKTIRVWDWLSGTEIFRFPGPAGEYNGMSRAMAFSPDGSELSADRGDGTLAVWDLETGKEIRRLEEKHEITATCVDYSEDGELLASGSWGGVLRVWNTRTGQLLHRLLEHSHRISALSFGFTSSNAPSLATASFDRTLKVWDPAAGTVLRSWKGHSGIVSGLVFSPDGQRLASCGVEDKAVKLWDPQTGREILTLRGHEAMCHSVAFSPDGQQLASSSQDGTICIWDARPPKPNEAMESLTLKHDSEIWSASFSPDGQLLASGSWDNTVRLWDTRSGRNIRSISLAGSVFSVAFSPDGRLLAAASFTAQRGARITAWEVNSGREVLAINEKAFPFCVTFDPSGNYLLREGPDFSLNVWSVQAGEEAGVIGNHGFNIWAMKFSPDGRRLATASSDGFIKLWAWQINQLRQPREPELSLPTRIVLGYGNRVAFSSDGHQLFSGGHLNTVQVWDARTGEERESLSGHTGEVMALAVDSDNQWLASAGEDTTIRIWDAKSLRPLHTLRGHTGIVMSLTFSPDGQQLVSASRDRTVKFWDTARWAR